MWLLFNCVHGSYSGILLDLDFGITWDSKTGPVGRAFTNFRTQISYFLLNSLVVFSITVPELWTHAGRAVLRSLHLLRPEATFWFRPSFWFFLTPLTKAFMRSAHMHFLLLFLSHISILVVLIPSLIPGWSGFTSLPMISIRSGVMGQKLGRGKMGRMLVWFPPQE